ncbi:TPA: DNA polymerase III subunit epsilon, partial [Streptococcus agalactiae]|nr:DNA polymerase III subunit epsilon [Streptococcus agalactiae]HEM9155023.1 DNA polymerase III subunit epsilon [Streptococcus agalactiae]HEO8136162.1 DNA polymerase III subunit epsilon [Streptococcus agalactiae]
PLMENVLSNTDVKNILVSINNKVYNSQNNIIEKDLIDRKDIKINPVNNRIPVSEIQNLTNWHKGFDLGFPFWEEGEKYRKEGNLKRSILLYDLARSNGYCSPALFESYAMAFHRLKDYENEIDILDEGIEREGNLGRLITRRNNAMKMLIKSRNEQKKIKENESAENILFSEIEILKRKKTRKNARPVLKMDDEMNILEHFESISDAVKKTGINSKSIRDASKGIQKHAGGFVWRYEDEYK